MGKSTLSLSPDSSKILKVNKNVYLFNPETLRIFNIPTELFKNKSTPKALSDCKKHDLVFSRQDFFPNSTSIILNKNSKSGLYAILCVTEQCNLRCSYCYRRDLRAPQNMTLEGATEIVNWLVEQDRNTIEKDTQLNLIFFGGEPLLCKEVVSYFLNELSNKITRFKPRFSISTNGILLDAEIVKLFKEHKVRVQISIDGNKNIQDKNRKKSDGTGTYDQILDKLKYFDLAEDKVSARVTVSKQNINFFEQILHLYKIGFQQLSLGFVVDSGGGKYDLSAEDLPLIKKEMDKLYSFFSEKLKLGEVLRINPIYDHLIFLSLRWSQYCCGATQNVFAFNYLADLYPCQRFVGRNDFFCGTATTGLNSSKLKHLKKKSCFNAVEDRCKSCWIRNLCGGKCYFLSTSEKVLDDDFPMRCLLEETLLHSAIENYIKIREANIPLLKTLVQNPGSSFSEHALGKELTQVLV